MNNSSKLWVKPPCRCSGREKNLQTLMQKNKNSPWRHGSFEWSFFFGSCNPKFWKTAMRLSPDSPIILTKSSTRKGANFPDQTPPFQLRHMAGCMADCLFWFSSSWPQVWWWKPIGRFSPSWTRKNMPRTPNKKRGISDYQCKAVWGESVLAVWWPLSW